MKRSSAAALPALAAFLLALAPQPASAATSTCLVGTTTRVSLTATGGEATGAGLSTSSSHAAVSADGRYVAFLSTASNLVANDTNGLRDVFVKDRATGATERVSVATDSAQGTGGAADLAPPTISADGRYVAFSSAMTNLVPGDTNARIDVFLRDRQLGTTELISATPTGAPGNADSSRPSISADGRFVAFASLATNLVPNDANGVLVADIFVRDRQIGTTTLASIRPDGTQFRGGATRPAISASGRYVAFLVFPSGPLYDLEFPHPAIYLRDIVAGATELVSVSTTGGFPNGSADDPAMSGDGRFVVFGSVATDLVAGDTNGKGDVFLRDRQLGTTELVSISSTGAQGNDFSRRPAISDDGRFVAFESAAPDLVNGDTNFQIDVLVRDRLRGLTYRESVSTTGVQGVAPSQGPAISADGRVIVFDSASKSLVTGKTTSFVDVFARELSEQPSTPPALAISVTPQPNADGWWNATATASLTPTGGCGGLKLTYSLSGAQTGGATVFKATSVGVTADGVTTLAATLTDDNGATAAAGATIRVDKTPPSVSYALDPPGGSSTDPVTVTFTASDRTSGLAGVPVDASGVATVRVTADPRLASTVSQTFTDRAGNTTTAVAGMLPLTVDASASPAPTDAGWNRTDVTVTITASGGSVGTHRITYQLTGAEDRGATVTACSFRSCEVDSITLTIKTEGTTTLSYSATDAAGNSTATRSLEIKIDKTPPDVSYVLDPPGGSSTDPVTVTFTASDALSGLAGVPVDAGGVVTVRVTVDPRLTSSVSRTFTDRAGNAPVVTADVLPARGCVVGTTRRASVTSSGAQVHGASVSPAISADGRFVAFASAASDLVPGDTNGVTDIFVHDRLTGAIERVSVSSAGAQANGGSSRPVISQHGLLVVFESDATNLVLGDTNGKRDIFVHNRLTHSTTRVSVNSDGTQIHAFGPSSWESFGGPTIDGSGRFVAFTGSPISGFDFPHVLLHDRVTHTTTIASLAETGLVVRSTSPALSGDGRYLAYVAGCCSATFDLLIRDLAGGTVTRASHNVFGSDLSDPVLSGDGRYAAFTAKPSTLLGTHVQVYDRVSGSTKVVAAIGFPVAHPSISADGRYIAFFSLATNLVTDDTNGKADVFVYDQTTGAIERASVSSQGLQADGGSHDPAISGDGQVVAFASDATNIGSGDTNATSDIYVRERQGLAPSCSAAPPVIVAAVSAEPNAAGWHSADVTIALTASGGAGGLQTVYALSGAQTGGETLNATTATITISTEGTTTLTYFAQDASGAKSEERSLTIKLDKMPPVATVTRTPAPNPFGWNNTDVRVTFSATDALSGIAADASFDVLFSEEGANQGETRSFADLAGNVGSATISGINIDRTPPTIGGSRTPAANADGWNNSPVTVSFGCADNAGGSGLDSCAGPTTLGEGAAQSVSGTATDKAGNITSTIVAGINVDTTLPTITATADRAPDHDGWYTNPVMISFPCSDTLSGIKGDCPAAVVVDADGRDQTVSATVFDRAGNSAGASLSVNVDRTAPTISGAATPPANASGWNNTDVTVTFNCADATSGVASCTAPVTLSAEGADQSVTGTAADNAGNSASATVSRIGIDKTPPAVTYSGNAGTYTVDQGVNITCAAADALSGIASTTCQNVSGPAYSFDLGTNSSSATAADNAGNTGSGSMSFTVTVDATSLGNLIDRFVTNAGVAEAMKAQVRSIAAAPNANAKAGKLGAFTNLVNAQTGKSLTASQAAILIRLAGGL